MAVVRIPALLRDLTGGATSLQVSGATVREVIRNLEELYPGVQARLCENEMLRPNISLVVDGAVSQQRLRHKLQETSEIHFLPAISGGEDEFRGSCPDKARA
jgi:sulfur-carrier protein